MPMVIQKSHQADMTKITFYKRHYSLQTVVNNGQEEEDKEQEN